MFSRLRTIAYGPEDSVALVDFVGPEAHYFGPPHDDFLHRHPLHARGLDIYGAFEVHDSSWIRELQHIAGRQINARHFILTFHDITFECVASGFKTSIHKERHPADVIRSVTTQSK